MCTHHIVRTRKDGKISMITGRLRRRAGVFGSLAAAATLLATTATPQLASADTTRTVTGSTTCTSGIEPYGFQVNYGAGWTSDGTSVWPPGTKTKIWTWVIPSSATSIALDTFCYYNDLEYNGRAFYPYGTWNGYTYSLTPGTSNVTSSWSCGRYPVYPGPFVRTCSLTSISYG